MTVREVGTRPMVVGCLAVIVGVPVAMALVGYGAAAAIEVTGLGLGKGVEEVLFTTLQFLVYSPILTWALLPPGILLALVAARLGLGGWLVALALGGAAGVLLQVAPTSSWGSERWSWPVVPIAAVIAGAFWLGVRLDRPDLFRPDGEREHGEAPRRGGRTNTHDD